MNYLVLLITYVTMRHIDGKRSHHSYRVSIPAVSYDDACNIAHAMEQLGSASDDTNGYDAEYHRKCSVCMEVRSAGQRFIVPVEDLGEMAETFAKAYDAYRNHPTRQPKRKPL